MTKRSLVWFRNDLRVDDNPALTAARERGDAVAVFVPATRQWRSHGMGANRLAFLLRTLTALSDTLAALHIPLLLGRDAPFTEHAGQLVRCAGECGADALFCNGEYALDERRRDAAVARQLRAAGIAFVRCSGGVVVPPGSVVSSESRPYTVFTPFKRRWLAVVDAGMASPVGIPPVQRDIGIAASRPPAQLDGVDATRLAESWPGGERAASDRLTSFAAQGIARYHEDRDRPDRDGTSRLSPYLAVGAVSPRRCLQAALDAGIDAPGAQAWRDELIWREFYQHATAAFDGLSRGAAFRPANDTVEWRDDPAGFDAWRTGRTGYPLVDAAMRQLTGIGWMHNRLRMLVAMFLTKHLLIDWRAGERHFMEMLVDGDFAANNGGWQWSAGTGTDAAPYFRIFNPLTQARKFDPEGAFVRRWVPELARVAGTAIFEPWRTGAAPDYPAPIVEHAWARQRALAAFKRS
jgi:deoxyribodipyrimidine photo-lyase